MKIVMMMMMMMMMTVTDDDITASKRSYLRRTQTESSCTQYLQNKMTVMIMSRPPTTPDARTIVAKYGGRPDVMLASSSRDVCDMLITSSLSKVSSQTSSQCTSSVAYMQWRLETSDSGGSTFNRLRKVPSAATLSGITLVSQQRSKSIKNSWRLGLRPRLQ